MTSHAPAAMQGMIRVIRTPAYLILTLALLLPLFDYVNGLLPLRLGDPLWRFGATSLIASYAVATTAQLLFLFVIAVMNGDRKVMFALAIASMIVAFGLLAGSGLYMLDALQARSRTSAATQTRLELTAGVVMLKLLSLIVANVVLSRFALKAARQARSSVGTKTDQILVSRASTPASARP